jgi:SAM-dependent methyltransferase
MKTEEKMAKRSYDFMAKDYHDYRTKVNPKGWFYNEFLEMPATLELLGNVRNKKILDFGCGSGIYARQLKKKGAIIKGFDISKEMIKIAKENNSDLDLRIGSGYNIPFNEKFDVVLSALTVHYLKDWDKMFREVRRILKKGGYFIFSTDNPITVKTKKIKVGGKKNRILGEEDYFYEGAKEFKINFPNGKRLSIITYRKTYETIIKTIIRNNFEIIDYKDTFPDKKAKKLFPRDYSIYSKIPMFCVWKVRKK